MFTDGFTHRVALMALGEFPADVQPQFLANSSSLPPRNSKNLIAIFFNSNGLHGLQPRSDGLQPNSDGLQPNTKPPT